MKAFGGISIRALWLVCICLAINASAQAQTVNRPEMKVGDRWKYEQRDGFTNLVSSNKEVIITAVGQERIDATDNGMPAIYSVDMNPVETPEARFEPTSAIFKFPFSLGDKWSWQGKAHLKSTATTLLNQYDVKVDGQEKLTVRGGTFDTYKLVMRGYITGGGDSRSGNRQFTRTYWYAPQAKGFVKILNEDLKNPWTMELLEFSLTQ